ncbi:MAG: Lrp/AsnC family transcriptional regulator [Anaerolineales bacterium]|nr:Lrp/AsnC family transcriptional regulator [Anaerolineales bacterium]
MSRAKPRHDENFYIMPDSSPPPFLDSIDRTILDILQAEGRISNAELARQINLSPPACHARLKRLEDLGYIQQYTALLNADQLGYDILCFVNVSLQQHTMQQVEQFRKQIQAMPEVLECYHITGEFDYLLKVIIRNRKDLERFIVDKLTPLPGVARIYTSLALTVVKATTAIPIPSPKE